MKHDIDRLAILSFAAEADIDPRSTGEALLDGPHALRGLRGHADALERAHQEYEAAVAATERVASEIIVHTRRLGVAIANRDAACVALARLEMEGRK